MTTTYYVIKHYTCPTCEGERMIYHPRWDEFWNEWARDHDTQPTQSDIQDWFIEVGFDYIPKEEIPCPECDGAGSIHVETAIEEALQQALQPLLKKFEILSSVLNIGFVEVSR